MSGDYYGSFKRPRDDSYNYGSYKAYKQLDGNQDFRTGGRYANDSIYQNYSGEGGYIKHDFDNEDALFSRPNTGINFDKYDKIDVSIEGNNSPSPINSFDEASLHPKLMRNITLAKYTKPTPVQKYSIPIVLSRRDLIASAQTGSGKTGGFLFPIINGLLKDNLFSEPPPRDSPSLPSAVILAPTRELANQIYVECRKFVYQTRLRALCLYGGTSVNRQCLQVEKGVDIVIATPGRLRDLCDRRKISFRNVAYLCLDEADRMLDMGFEREIRDIVQERDMPRAGERRTLMFSATFPRAIQRLAADFLSNYLFLKVGPVGSTSENIKQRILWVEESAKESTLLTELKEVTGRTLVFVETKRKADMISYFLRNNGLLSSPIHGDLKQHEREYALNEFKRGRINILVATDVAARGLDIESVEHVINFDLPNQIDDYVHRIGRTGRAGNVGIATAFYNSRSSNIARDLIERLKEANQEIPSWLEKERNKPYDNSKNMRGGRDRRNNNFGRSRDRPYSASYGGRPGNGKHNSFNGGGYNNQVNNYDGSGYNNMSSSGNHYQNCNQYPPNNYASYGYNSSNVPYK